MKRELKNQGLGVILSTFGSFLFIVPHSSIFSAISFVYHESYRLHSLHTPLGVDNSLAPDLQKCLRSSHPCVLSCSLCRDPYLAFLPPRLQCNSIVCGLSGSTISAFVFLSSCGTRILVNMDDCWTVPPPP